MKKIKKKNDYEELLSNLLFDDDTIPEDFNKMNKKKEQN